jgi:hypothetical protein
LTVSGLRLLPGCRSEADSPASGRIGLVKGAKVGALFSPRRHETREFQA